MSNASFGSDSNVRENETHSQSERIYRMLNQENLLSRVYGWTLAAQFYFDLEICLFGLECLVIMLYPINLSATGNQHQAH